MRAVRIENGAVGLVERPPPRGEGVRVRIRSVGICGSDLHMLALGMVEGLTPGHEMCGETDDGTPVAVEPLVPCGHCEFCLRGDVQLCRRGGEMVIGAGRDGGMTEELLVPERALVPLPRGARLADACLVEPLAVAVHGLRRVSLSGAERILVVGGGALGLCTVAAAVTTGAAVALAARHDAQREAGERLGARELDPATEYDVVVDAAGTHSSLEDAVARCRPGGALVLVGSYWDGMVMPAAICMKEIDVHPSSMYGRHGVARDFDVAAAILAQHPAIGETLISHRFPLEAAAEAFRTAADRRGGAIKVVLEP